MYRWVHCILCIELGCSYWYLMTEIVCARSPFSITCFTEGGIHWFCFVFQCVRVGKLLFGCKISAIVIAGWGGRGRGGLVVDRLGLGWLCWGGQRVSDLPLRRLERIWPKHYNLPPRCLSSIVRRIWPGLALTPPLYWSSIFNDTRETFSSRNNY